VISRMWPLPDLLACGKTKADRDRDRALAAYERLRVLLREELGVNPSQAVQDAHTKLLA
jgi:DNA-binding SARP family transcriptional activator